MRKFNRANGLMVAAAAVAIISIATCIAFAYAARWEEVATLLAGLLAAAAVAYQGELIKRQIEVSTFLSLENEWNGKEMIKMREAAFNREKNVFDVPKLEGILEFFEKVAGFHAAGYLDFDLIFDSTLGWYAVRYYFYARSVINELRSKVWKDTHLYEHLESLYQKWVPLEHVDRAGFEGQLAGARGEFFEREQHN